MTTEWTRREGAVVSGIGRRGPRLDVTPRDPGLADFAGQWVAVKDGRVVASHPKASEVAKALLALGEDGEGAVLQRVAGPMEAVAIGMG